MRFVENRSAGSGMREFRNLDDAPKATAPHAMDLRYARVVRQLGTKDSTGVMYKVTVLYHSGEKRSFKGWKANRILKSVQRNRTDVRSFPDASTTRGHV